MSPVTNASRRLLLKLPVLASTSALLLSACEGSLDKKTAKATGVMSKQLRFPEQAAHLGISFPELCAWLVEDASCLR